MSDPTTEQLIEEFTALRGPYGEGPGGDTAEERIANEAQLNELYRALQARNALPPLLSKAPGFGGSSRRRSGPFIGLN